MEKSKVYFCDMRAKPGMSLLDKLKKLMNAAGIGEIDMEKKFVAIKIHFGEPGNLSYLRPNFAKAVAEVVKISCGKYDMLSSLALSFTAIMLVNPLNIISVGFQLSVAAVAGIALFNSKINGALRRIKIPQKISSSCRRMPGGA